MKTRGMRETRGFLVSKVDLKEKEAALLAQIRVKCTDLKMPIGLKEAHENNEWHFLARDRRTDAHRADEENPQPEIVYISGDFAENFNLPVGPWTPECATIPTAS